MSALHVVPAGPLMPGWSVHIVRDYCSRGLLGRWRAPRAAIGLFDDAALHGCAFACGAASRRASAWRRCALCRALDAADGDEAPRSFLPFCPVRRASAASGWPDLELQLPPCRPSRHSTRRVCH